MLARPSRKLLLAPIALGMLAPLAHAQSQVSIYGIIDEYAGAIRTATASTKSSTAGVVNSGGMTTSFIGFRGAEDLGGGTKAIFNLESFIRADTGVPGRNDSDVFWGRASFMGLESARWGSLTMGRHVTPYAINLAVYSPLPGSTTFSPSFATVFKGNVLGDTRFNNSVHYLSPKLNGFVIDGLYSFGTEVSSGPDSHQNRAFDGAVRYEGRHWGLGVATRQINLNANDNGRKQKSYMVGGNYDFGFAQVYGQAHQSHESYAYNSSQDVRRRAYELSAGIPVGPGKFAAAYAYSSIRDDSAATPSQRRVWSLSYDYLLSKRTDVYAIAYRDLQRNPLIEQRILGVGVRHRF